MKNSIETIWKQGFLNENSLVAPKINDLYNQKSNDLVHKIEMRYKTYVFLLVFGAIACPIIYYFLDALWQGVVISILFLLTVCYSEWQKRSFKTLEHGATSLDYLKSLHRWLKDALLNSGKVLRFTYPLYFLIVMSVMWSAWNKGELTSKIYQKYPDVIFIESVPLSALIVAALATLLMFYFSGRIYRWDVGLMYGRIFRKLEETIAEMEKLKQG